MVKKYTEGLEKSVRNKNAVGCSCVAYLKYEIEIMILQDHTVNNKNKFINIQSACDKLPRTKKWFHTSRYRQKYHVFENLNSNIFLFFCIELQIQPIF